MRVDYVKQRASYTMPFLRHKGMSGETIGMLETAMLAVIGAGWGGYVTGTSESAARVISWYPTWHRRSIGSGAFPSENGNAPKLISTPWHSVPVA